MIVNPATIGLTAGSALTSAMAVYASATAVRVLRLWDLSSGSETQLALERRTYLISTLLSYGMGFQLLSLFLFVYTADSLHRLFVGAMCAAGTLNVNEYGYPALVLKVVNFLLCGVWLVLNAADNRAPDYPLIRAKYRLLLFLTGTLVLETLLQTGYFLKLDPQVITSCCGTLFSADSATFPGEVASLSPRPAQGVFALALVLVGRTGSHLLIKGKGARAFSLASSAFLVVAVAAIISFISLYFYELPTHHCPFCLLQGEYHHIGYALYLFLLVPGILGASVGVMDRFKGIPSLGETIARLQRRLCLLSMAGYAAFTAISIYPMLFSDFKLGGY
jgi:hypothetical protein